MADKTSLGVVGFLFGSITLVVTVIAFLVVRDHLDGRLQLESAAASPQLVSISTH
jgi:phage-related holin